MPGGLSLAVALAFVLSVGILIGVGLVVIGLVLRAQARHRKRLARVSRKRISGRIDIEDARLSLQRQREGANGLSDALARFIPLLDTERLRAKIQRAQLSLTVTGFIMSSLAVAGILGLAATLLLGLSPVLALLPCLFGGMLICDGLVGSRGEAIAARFMRQLPEGLDTIIRGVRSGLPVIECIATVGQDFEAPLGSYFRNASERIRLGEPLDAAIWRVARMVDRPEMDFLAISMAIQIETGGSLAEALGNLADLLRKRQQMKLKIKAISSEARASAMIVGALPFVMLGLLLVTSPDYILPLFSDPRGQMMLLLALGSITMGAFVMWRMTKFEI